MERNHNPKYRFGSYTLEPDERRILGEGASPIELTAKAFDLLLLLVSKAGQLVTKDEILDAVWPEVSIAEGNLTTTISMIRKALQEDSERRYIETVPKKGYRFVAPVSVVVDQVSGTAGQADHTSAPPAPSGRRPRFLISGILIILIAVGIGFDVLQHRHPRAPYQDALRHEAEGSDQLAIKELGDLPRANPNFADARLKAAWLLYQADRDDEANEALSEIGDFKSSANSSEHERATSLKIAGLKKLRTDQIGDALVDFQAAADADHFDVDALIYIADTAIREDSLDEADKALAECMKRDERNPICGYERIDALGREGKFDPAIAEYNRLHSFSNNPSLEQAVGYAELAQGQIHEAQEHFAALRKLDADFWAAQDAAAVVYLLAGRLSDARRELEYATTQAPSPDEKADYLIFSAEIDALNGERDRAKGELTDADALSNKPELTIAEARVYAIIGDSGKAKSLLDGQRKAAPGLGRRYAAARPFVEGMESFSGRDFKRAEGQLTSSFEKDRNPETAYFLAHAEMSLKEWDSAIDHLSFINNSRVRVFIDSVASLIPLSEYDLGVCYRAKGQESTAQKHFSSAREMWKDADPGLRARFTDSASNAATKIRNSR
jgi:DNA-binding winged helix-turn-helix (wHTH) protein/tetratricopeptide (TPR) repeat protein